MQLKKRVNANAAGMTKVLAVKRVTVTTAKIANVVFVIVLLPTFILSNSAYKTEIWVLYGIRIIVSLERPK